MFTFKCCLRPHCSREGQKLVIFSYAHLKRLIFCLRKDPGNSRSNKFFQELPSVVANRNVPGASQSSGLNRRGFQRGSSARNSRQLVDQGGTQAVDIEDDESSADRGDSYKAMAASMATKRSVR